MEESQGRGLHVRLGRWAWHRSTGQAATPKRLHGGALAESSGWTGGQCGWQRPMRGIQVQVESGPHSASLRCMHARSSQAKVSRLKAQCGRASHATGEALTGQTGVESGGCHPSRSASVLLATCCLPPAMPAPAGADPKRKMITTARVVVMADMSISQQAPKATKCREVKPVGGHEWPADGKPVVSDQMIYVWYRLDTVGLR